jgi:hypothetical protein
MPHDAREATRLNRVMAGLDPAIHDNSDPFAFVDARDKPGHDG